MFTNHSEYNAFFRQLCALHVDLQHTAEESHFARIILSSDPYLSARDQINEFLDGIRSELQTPFMLLVAYDNNYADNEGDFDKKVFNGAFVILDLPDKGCPDSEEHILDKTEAIGEDIIAYTLEMLEENPEYGFMPVESIENEKVAKVAGKFYGTRYAFTLVQEARQLTFNESRFTGAYMPPAPEPENNSYPYTYPFNYPPNIEQQ